MILNLNDLKNKKVTELHTMALEMGIDNASNLRLQELIFAILQAQDTTSGGGAGTVSWVCTLEEIFNAG